MINNMSSLIHHESWIDLTITELLEVEVMPTRHASGEWCLRRKQKVPSKNPRRGQHYQAAKNSHLFKIVRLPFSNTFEPRTYQ